ncbi:MAG: caspase family protein [Rhizobiaceae bacterium]
MTVRFPVIFLAFLTLLQIAGQAFGETRVALVIGIAEYRSVPALRNTIKDSELVGRTLEALDFKVTRLSNASADVFRDSVRRFAFDAETADVALVYFAGHGVEVGGRNFLVPSDIQAANRSELATGSVTLDEVLAAVDKARQLRIVILDSCRDDPFARQGANELVELNLPGQRTTGLAPPSPDRGTLVAFAAEAGAVALDGAGENSPFALALASNLASADLEIGLMFRRVRDQVLKSTGNKQEPHTYGSLSGNPYFLAGRSTEINTLDNDDRRVAWANLAPDQEEQLAALAQDGDSRALKGLAYMRLNPDEARFDPTEAVTLLQKAADAGDPEAMFELGKLFEQGIGTKQDTQKALELFRRSADLDFADAINDLGFLHFQGGQGIVRDQKKAISLFARAAELRHPEAMFNYAALIDDGVVQGKGAEDSARFLYEALRSGNEDVLKQLSNNPNMFKQTTRSALQRKLQEQELYQGTIDGAFGPQTKRSLRRAYGIVE